MAGDWIKVEHATADKPEVMRGAEMLGIGLDQMLGILLRYWFWLDENLSGLCPDSVRNISRKGLDERMRCSGFAATLESVGWATFDDEQWILRVTNADRHNGTPAKSRALESKRKRGFRPVSVRKMSGSKPDENRLEKRREEKITTSLRSVVSAPPKKMPTQEHETLAAELGVSCRAEWEKYSDHFSAQGKPHKNPSAGFRNWLRRAGEWQRAPPRQTAKERGLANMDIITGRDNGRINGTAERVGGAAVPALPSDLRKPGRFDVGGG